MAGMVGRLTISSSLRQRNDQKPNRGSADSSFQVCEQAWIVVDAREEASIWCRPPTWGKATTVPAEGGCIGLNIRGALR